MVVISNDKRHDWTCNIWDNIGKYSRQKIGISQFQRNANEESCLKGMGPSFSSRIAFWV
jgi:hypothetical protein